MKFLLVKKCKSCKIYRRICDVYGEACLSQKMFTNGLNMEWQYFTLFIENPHKIWVNMDIEMQLIKKSKYLYNQQCDFFCFFV